MRNDPVFVFGSNEAGRHGASAARYALLHKGAQYGQGFGHYGNSFAIPTKDFNVQTIDLSSIKFYVDYFLSYAASRPELTFQLTPIGCGLAGYSVEDIVPMFDLAPSNVVPPDPTFDEVSKEFYDLFHERHSLQSQQRNQVFQQAV